MAVKVNGSIVIDDNRDFTSNTASVQATDLVVTQKFSLPSGTTAQRPASPVVGQLFFDTDEGTIMSYDGTDWV